MKIALAQINTTIGDFEGNLKIILDYVVRAGKLSADLVVFPEMAITGYPPKDLLDRPDFIEAAEKAIKDLTQKIHDPACVVGFIGKRISSVGKPLTNAAALIHQKKILGIKNKVLLPTYDVFDEGRYFEPGKTSPIFNFMGRKIGVSICEDIWNDHAYWGGSPYPVDPVLEQARAGAEILINISASPYSRGKEKIRYDLLRRQALHYQAPLVYVNLVGGNDDLIFDGSSMVIDGQGRMVKRLKSFSEDIQVVDMEKLRPIKIPKTDEEEMVLDALILGLKDYMRKCGFKKVVIGLSGGIDSSLTAWIACAALGPKNVLGLCMPSEFSSKGSLTDAQKMAKSLGMTSRVFPISGLYEKYKDTLKYDCSGKVDTTLQNIQARIRGNILMAVSNREGRLLLSTGNKSEMSVGYCTLYGDMAGGLAILSDVPKILVYRLARIANRRKKAIPLSVFIKAPSAELAPHQRDADDLPPYKILDGILERYIERHMSPQQIVAEGFEKKTVADVLHRLDANEYKRGQAPPGLRITTKAFGYGWRVPISSRYRVKL